MNTAYKFRIYPNKEQIEQIHQTFGCVRFVYNFFLAMRIDNYRFTGKTMTYKECSKYLTYLKKMFQFLNASDSTALQQSLRHLNKAYKNFFKSKEVGFPKYKSKHKSKMSYTTTSSAIRLGDKYIKLPKIGNVKMKQHRRIPEGYVLTSATVSMTKSGEYFVSVCFQHENQVQEVSPKKFLGLDYSSPYLYIDSEGNEPGYPRFYRTMESKLAREQRKLSKMKFCGKNWHKQKRRVAKLHEKVANQRRDFLHKLSKEIADNYDVVAIEDLNMQSMSKSLNLGKSTMDNGWGMFTTFLDYKLERRGKQLVKIDKWFASTKTCHECGNEKPMMLNERQYVCPECGMVFDRDWNAAINIRDEGKRMLTT